MSVCMYDSVYIPRSSKPLLCVHAYVLTIWLCVCLHTVVTVHVDSVCAVRLVCVSWRSLCLRGLTGERELNLNAGHCAACRFWFCRSMLRCAQAGNPSNMARIPIKSNNLLPPTAIEAHQLQGDRWRTQWTWQVILQRTGSHISHCVWGSVGSKLARGLHNWTDVGMCGHQFHSLFPWLTHQTWKQLFNYIR